MAVGQPPYPPCDWQAKWPESGPAAISSSKRRSRTFSIWVVRTLAFRSRIGKEGCWQLSQIQLENASGDVWIPFVKRERDFVFLNLVHSLVIFNQRYVPMVMRNDPHLLDGGHLSGYSVNAFQMNPCRRGEW